MRLTALGVLVLFAGVAFTGLTVWRKATYRSTYATILNVTRHVTLSPHRTAAYDATVQYPDDYGRVITLTTAFRASWLKFEQGERVPILVNRKDSTDFKFNTFLPSWGFSLLLLGAGAVIICVGKAL